MKKVEKAYFTLKTFKVCVELREDVPKGFTENAVGGCYDEPDENLVFTVWFKGGAPGLKIIAHECWHLFMTVMNYIDMHEHTFKELNSEVYAYDWHEMVDNVLTCLFNMKRYQAGLEEEESEN